MKVDGLSCSTINCRRRATARWRGRDVCGRCFEELEGTPVRLGHELLNWLKKGLSRGR